jgi:1-deoxy-D-xylulose 5-phosphate reductoisomerase
LAGSKKNGPKAVRPSCVYFDFVEIAGREEHHPEGSYYIEWWNGPKRLRRSVGKNALAAEAQRHQQEQILTARVAGLKAGLKFATEGDKVLLANAVTLSTRCCERITKNSSN